MTLEEEIDRDDKTWKERRRIGTVEYHAPTNAICFYDKPDDPSEEYFYFFPFSECQTYNQYNDWFQHLRCKMWFTKQIEWNLVEVLERLGQSGNFEGADESVFARELENTVDYDSIKF